MPNHITNSVRIYCNSFEKATEIKNALFVPGESKEEMKMNIYGVLRDTEKDREELALAIRDILFKSKNDLYFDFNKIVPMPKNGEIVDGKPFNDGSLMASKMDGNILDEFNWYGWCCKHWGTKWNAYETNEGIIGKEGKRFYIDYNFLTAWSAPLPVIQELSKKFKTEVEIKFYDEDFGSNCGRFLFKNGKNLKEEYYKTACDESYDFILEAFNDEGVFDTHCMFKDDNGHWYCNED